MTIREVTAREMRAWREGARSATFLPAVWESLPEPEDFLGRLREKAGLPSRYWSPTLRFERYTTREAS